MTMPHSHTAEDDHVHADPHDHAHAEPGHARSAGQPSRQRRLLFAFALTVLMMLGETAGGLWSGSLALLADAGHMMVDSLALLLAFVGAWLATKPADARRSYGYGRLEVLAGFVNSLTQFVLVGFIVYEAAGRLLHPGHILSGVMLVVASAGLALNVLVLRLLHAHAHDDVNMASASLHVLGDLLGSVGAVLAALAIRWFGWNCADPVLSIVVSLLILNSAWRLLRKSAHILLEGVPDGLDSAEIGNAVRAAIGSVLDIHHLHVWQLASGARMATLHAELHEGDDSAAVVPAIHRLLRERFGIQHVTVQIDHGDCLDSARPCDGQSCH